MFALFRSFLHFSRAIFWHFSPRPFLRFSTRPFLHYFALFALFCTISHFFTLLATFVFALFRSFRTSLHSLPGHVVAQFWTFFGVLRSLLFAFFLRSCARLAVTGRRGACCFFRIVLR